MRSLQLLSPKSLRALAALGLVNLTVYLISAYYVNVYYAHNPPHFDSVGSLTLMFDYINRVRRDGAWSAWSFARQHDSVSWIQGAYAVLLADVLPRTPAALMTLNFVCLFAAQAALFDLGRRLGASRLQSFAFGLLPLLPDALFGHYGTYQDMRRDASFLSLLLTTYAISLTYVREAGPPRPAPWRGIVLGFAAGLTQLARGNALPFLAIVLTPALVMSARRVRLNRRWSDLLYTVGVPLTPFVLLTLSFYASSGLGVLKKYSFNYDQYTPRWTSLAHYVWSPIILMFGEPSRVLALKLAVLFIGLPTIIFFGQRANELTWQPHAAMGGTRRWLWLGGGWVVASVIGMLTVVFGTSPKAGYEPVFPLLIGVFSLIIAASFTVSWRNGRLPASFKRTFALAGLLVFAVWSGTDKLRLATYPHNEEVVRTARELTPMLRDLAGGNRVAWLWDGHLNYWVVNYYLAQAGEPVLKFDYAGADLERLVTPWLGETVESRSSQIREALLTSDALILSDTPDAYVGVIGHDFFDTYGYLIVPDLLASPKFEQIYQFQSEGYHFVILKRIQ